MEVNLYERDDNIWVSSLEIAKRFEKRHDNVLRDVRELVDQCDNEFSRLNFEEIEYKDSYGRSQPMYEITRDGFSLLAMGFTGEKALKWKVKFIEAFSYMLDYIAHYQKFPQHQRDRVQRDMSKAK